MEDGFEEGRGWFVDDVLSLVDDEGVVDDELIGDDSVVL